jgi:hypothetical protein
MARTDTSTLNYRGELFLIGANQTPFLNMIGGLSGGMRSTSFRFPIGQSYSLAAASQDVQSEVGSVAAGTPQTTAPAEVYNVCQIMKKDVQVSFKKQSQTGFMSGLNVDVANPINDPLEFQRQAQLRQLAIDIEYSFIQGTYAPESTTSTAVATRGMLEAITTNAKAASGAKLSKPLLNLLLRTMADAGAEFSNPVIFASAFDVQNISDAYGYAPTDRNVGGVAIKSILTDFAQLGVVWDKQVPAGSIIVADMAKCAPVFVPVSFNANMGGILQSVEGADVLWVPTAVTAAAAGGFLYTQIGLDHGIETFHGKITGLATS